MGEHLKETAILYSEPMILARNDDMKTQTRRGMTPQPRPDYVFKRMEVLNCKGHRYHGHYVAIFDIGLGMEQAWKCPYGKPGDLLWPREAWRTEFRYDHLPPRDVPREASINYLADKTAPMTAGRYRHARFMCRWMSRGLDEVVQIRVEKVQSISENDAIAEGIRQHNEKGGWINSCMLPDGKLHFDSSAYGMYRQLWESINGKPSWDANDWVWVVTFKKVR